MISPWCKARRAQSRSHLRIKASNGLEARANGTCAPCRTSWLLMIPVTPFSVHHLFVTSGPKAMPTPCGRILKPRSKSGLATCNVHVCLVHGQASLEDQSTRAGFPALDSTCVQATWKGFSPRLRSQLCISKSYSTANCARQDVLTHETRLTRLSPYSVNLADLLQRDPVFAEEAAVYYKVPLEALRRENRACFLLGRFGRTDHGGEGHCTRRKKKNLNPKKRGQVIKGIAYSL